MSNYWLQQVLEAAMDRDPILVERNKTHGAFFTNAECSQKLKDVLKGYGYKDLGVVHKEALEMICLKVSRIMSGQAKFKDHWDDIAGYAKLGAEACDA